MNHPLMRRLGLSGRRYPAALWYLTVCLIASLLFVIFQGGKLATMLLGSVTVLSIYLVLGNWSGIKRTLGERALGSCEEAAETQLDAGQPLEVRIRLQIPGIWPIPYVVVRDRLLRQNGEEIGFEGSLVPDWKRRGEWTYSTPPLRRGFYRFGTTECVTEDIFGFFQHKGRLQLQQQVVVYPQTVMIKEWLQFHQMIKGLQHHSTTTRAQRETTQINGVREYIYGDRISRIHWNATAKTGTWKSKEFERESLPKTIVLLDRTAAAYRDAAEFELAVSTAASLLRYGSSRQLALGLLSVGRELAFFEPKVGHKHLKETMNHLVGVEADGHRSLLQIIRDRTRDIPSGSFFVIISPQKGAAVLQAMNYLNQHQINPCHFWIHSAEGEALREDWLKAVRARGYLGYEVDELAELSSILGGAKRYA